MFWTFSMFKIRFRFANIYELIQKMSKSIVLNCFTLHSRFDGTTDAIGAQFFLKNVHPRMKAAASTLFGLPNSIHARPNTFGELMRAVILPTKAVQEAVNWALKGVDPDIVLHMRMMINRYAEPYF
jgi:hypothetical protein